MEPNALPVDKEKSFSLKKLLESLIHSGDDHLNKEELNKVLQICGENSEYIKQSFKYIFKLLEKKHAEIRFSATQLCHELFMKFEEFQKLLISDIHLFFKYTMGIKASEPLPPPKATANKLKKSSMQYFLQWHNKFSRKYFKLKLALEYLDEIEHVDFRTFEIVDPKERKEREEKEKISKKLMKARLDKLSGQMKDLIPEIRCTLTSLESCFELLLPSPVNDELTNGDSNYEEDMRLFGVVNPKHVVPIEIKLSDKVPIKIDDENSALIDAAKDAYTLINNRFLPKVKAWIEIINKGEGERHNLKEAIVLCKQLENATLKYHRLDFINEKQEVKEDEVSTDSELEEVEEPKPPPKKKIHVESSLFSTSSEDKKIEKNKTSHAEDTPKSQPGPSNVQINDRKKKLLEVAPKLPFDIDLYHWEDEKLATPTMIATNTEGARFWGGGTEDLVELPIPDGASALRTRVIEFAGEWKPVNHTCRAPLSSGKLCPRQDREKCPFHGIIVERDDTGKILNKEDEDKVAKSKPNDVPDWQDPKLLAEIKAQTGLDLKMPEKGKRKKKKKKYPGLTDLNEIKNTPANRISKKIFNKKAVARVAATLDKIDQKKHRDKFGDQFNYVHGT
ncbi:UV-stimulated scaffold protein A [Halyomorpha halys]|uniref:UV-stimulated scaffold protein A n=1 Tax=Halyomorpha halys TaxID=286706 RepID=UPI0006D4EFC6|nr:UV-stimulated scaffold protein A-like [Halyomorpha halys]